MQQWHNPKIARLEFLILKLLTTTIVAPPSNARKWQTGFNSTFKRLTMTDLQNITTSDNTSTRVI